MQYDLSEEDILDVIISLIKQTYAGFMDYPADAVIDPKTFFVDLGINSIDHAEIMTLAMEKFGVDIPVEKFACTNCLVDAARLFFKALCKGG